MHLPAGLTTLSTPARYRTTARRKRSRSWASGPVKETSVASLAICNISGIITGGQLGDGPLVGPADLWIETLARWALDLGVDAFIYWAPDTMTTAVGRFAGDIVPAVRDAIADSRPADFALDAAKPRSVVGG
jgi:hypothetical protein